MGQRVRQAKNDRPQRHQHSHHRGLEQRLERVAVEVIVEHAVVTAWAPDPARLRVPEPEPAVVGSVSCTPMNASLGTTAAGFATECLYHGAAYERSCYSAGARKTFTLAARAGHGAQF